MIPNPTNTTPATILAIDLGKFSPAPAPIAALPPPPPSPPDRAESIHAEDISRHRAPSGGLIAAPWTPLLALLCSVEKISEAKSW